MINLSFNITYFTNYDERFNRNKDIDITFSHVRTIRVCYNIDQVCSKSKDYKAKQFKSSWIKRGKS